MQVLTLALSCVFASALPSMRLEDAVRALQRPQALRAHFVQRKTTKAFIRAQEVRGTVLVVKPRKLRLEYAEPYSMTLIVNGDRASMSYPKLKEKQSFNLGQDSTMKAVFETLTFFSDADIEGIGQRFTVTLEPPQGQEARANLRLVPKGSDVASIVHHVEVWIDVGSGAMSSVRLVQPNGSETVWNLSQIEIDPVIDEALLNP